MSRRAFLESEMVRIKNELDSINRVGREDAISRIGEIITQADRLINEARSLAEKYDIQFYYHDGYQEFVVEPEQTWDSSSC